MFFFVPRMLRSYGAPGRTVRLCIHKHFVPTGQGTVAANTVALLSE